ncbi:Spectrin beta chain, non-erythrocytic 5 [Entomortierella chlamydospora]|uniref:Spectrin beta chain, non-erythrocytic 5 n=1 Tax=Entomortierella chlamydospora TaxID=101097 RepID=A0A9P6T357_9FUNG|nr:Spectrin beta chain, non-erythrocytic 5 [Entomortierella chlamydospora]KAG0021653.1 Spectrin beta chain, non-erythrocytic 5 [Entomortierella chlamydospora]
MSWILRSKRLQSAGNGSNNNNGNSNSIYSQSSNNVSASSLSSNLSSVSLNNYGSLALTPALPSHHLDAGEDMVRQFAATQLDTQKTAFMRWVNVQLAPTKGYAPMTTISGLGDGKRLVALLEIVSKETLKPDKGNTRIHQMANVSKALDFLGKRTDEPLDSIGSENIVDGNIKLTLGLVWIIIYRFQIQQIANTMAELYPSLATEDIIEGDDGAKGKKKGTSQQVDAKQALLRWVRYQLEDYSDVIPPIQDFHRSWRTGLAFSALIHRHDPDFLPEFYTDILPLPFETPEEWRRCLTKAFEIAFEKMTIHRLLDPQDLVDVETPDERSIMTYVSEYYIVMSKHQMEQDPALAAEQRARRLQAKDERLALAGEDQLARRQCSQDEEERRRREEEEELERIRLKRMEIEGWSIGAAERAREEEEALRRKHEEEEEKRLQRELKREHKKTLSVQEGSNGRPRKDTLDSSGVGPVYLESEHEVPDSETGSIDSKEQERHQQELEAEPVDPKEQEGHQQELEARPAEPIDPKELEKRQHELEAKLAEYHQVITELLEWAKDQDRALPPVPDKAALLDRARDLEPLAEAIKAVEEEQVDKEHIMSHLHDVREELLEFGDPGLTPEQLGDMDKKWWELETIWTALTNKVVDSKDAAEEVKWIIDCSQEIDRVNGEISKFEAQLETFAEKRSQETPQERSQKATLEQQDVSLSSISFLIDTYVKFLTSLMDPKVHHYTAPEHLTTLNNELTEVRLPRLTVVIEKAQQNLSNDRLLRTFLDSLVLSEAWIAESVEWLTNIEVPIFVKEDRWNGGNTIKEYLERDVMKDLNLEFYQDEIEDLKSELEDEQSEVNTFRSSGFAKLDEQAKAVMKGLADTQDVTAESTTKAVQDLMKGVMDNLEMVEKLLPEEAEHCAYAGRVLMYLWEVLEVLEKLEQAWRAINRWEMRQPDSELEGYVIYVEKLFEGVDVPLREEQEERAVLGAVQNRHSGLSAVVKDLRVCFHGKQEVIKGDRQMKGFLDLTQTCQTTLRDLRAKLRDGPPMTGFGLNDPKPFDDFANLVIAVGKSLDEFENEMYAGYITMGEQVKIMATNSEARHDPTAVQNKLHGVNTLLHDIKALRGDRERDSITVAECRKLVSSLYALDSDLQALETDLADLEHLEPGQHGDLIELGNRSNHLRSQFAVLEQDRAYRHLKQDPSCSSLLGDIAHRQLSIEQTQKRLQAKLEVKQQWDMAWEAFAEQSRTLQQYLKDVENNVVERGYVSLDCLSAEESIWRRSDEAVREAHVANDETLASLKEFKVSRLSELSALAVSLQKVVELADGVDHMDQVRAGQFQESEEIQRALRDHLKRLHAMNSQEKHQLNTLGQRLLWSQHFHEAKAGVDILVNSCQNAMVDYTKILKSSEQSGDTTGLDHAAAKHLKDQIQSLVSLAAKDKKTRFDAALEVYSSLKELATASIPGVDSEDRDDDSEKLIPEHLEEELAAFKNQYDLLDLQLEFANQLAEHASQVASYLNKNDDVDSELSAIATELQAEEEATTETIEKASTIRAEFEDLSKEFQLLISNIPRPSEAVQSTLSQTRSEYQSGLENALKNRLNQSIELNKALDPLLEEYQELLRYQNGLRSLAKDLETHSQWLEPSNEKVKLASERIQAMFASWPEENVSRNTSQLESSSISESRSSELSGLKSELASESAHVENKEQEFLSIKQDINQALQTSTSHSRHLQLALERSLESIESRIQDHKANMRHKSYQLQCLEKQFSWEQELEKAQEWCRKFDATVSDFTQQAQWKHDSTETMNQMQNLDSPISEFEDQLRAFEDQTKPVVQQSWTEFCGSLVLMDKAIPEEFQDRQAAFDKESQMLRAKIAYSAEVLKQRKALEAMNARVGDLERLEADLAVIAATYATPDQDTSSQKDESKNALSLDELEAKIRSLAQELEADFGAMHYPIDGSTDEAKTRSQESNAQVRGHVQACRARVDAASQSLDEALHSREVFMRRKELEALQRGQDNTILDKANKLEKVSSLLSWANETTDVVSGILNSESSEVETKVTKNELPSIPELANLSKETLHSLSTKLDTLRQEINDMMEHKKEVQAEVLAAPLDDQIDGLHITTEDRNTTKIATGTEPTLHDIEDAIEQNRNKITQLDHDIVSRLSEFDSKTVSMLKSLDQQSETLASALEERLRLDEEIAHQQELERLRIQRELEIKQFEESKSKFLAWSESQLQELSQLWDSCGYFSKNDEPAKSYNGVDSVESAISSLETVTLRSRDDISQKESAYIELKNRIDSLYNGDEHESDRKRHIEGIDSAWSVVKNESAGYAEILNQMKQWSDLRRDLIRFEREGLDALEKRVEGLRWMHWDAFQPEEEQLLQLIEVIEGQANDLKARADMVSAIEVSGNIRDTHQAILSANRVYFERRLNLIPARIDASRNGIMVIHETSKEIALHAKFHADLVRVETAIAQQIEAVKARLGSLERSSCFALNSKELEAVVQSAAEVCKDGKYQLTILQELEYPRLEQTAFDLDMNPAEEPYDPEDNTPSNQTSVQESMGRIRKALKQLEGYIEEDCFETRLAVDFHTHCKATEDIRRWISSCRDDMMQLDAADKNQDLNDKMKRQQNRESKSRHLESIEEKLNEFSAGTIQKYDGISNDFMTLHHPQSSVLNLFEQSESAQGDNAQPVSMRVILRRTAQERTKRTREDWELLKQEFLTKAKALSLEDGDGSDVSEADQLSRGAAGSSPAVKAKTLSRLGTEILEDISRVTREVQEMFDHVSSRPSTLPLTVESDGALAKSKEGQAHLESIEAYIRDVLQVKVEKFGTMLSIANEQSEQDQALLNSASELDLSTRSHIRRQEKMVGVAMQRGLIAESMNRLVEFCSIKREEVEETLRVQNGMDLIHEVDMLIDSMTKALATADNLMAPPPEVPHNTSLYSIPSASSSSSSMNARSTRASPSVFPAATISRATVLSRERRASRARPSFFLSSLSEEDVQEWESNYHSLVEEMNRYIHDIEQHLDTISSMADRLKDWRLEHKYGVATEHWEPLKSSALAKMQELERIWARRSGGNEMNQGAGVHSLDKQPSSALSSAMQPTASSSNRAKAILGSPVDPSPPRGQRKRSSTTNIMSRNNLLSPPPALGGSTAGKSTRTSTGRGRSGTTTGLPTTSANTSLTNVARRVTSPVLHSMTPTLSQEAKRKPPVIRKNDSTSSISSIMNTLEASRSPSMQQQQPQQQQQQRTIYKPDMNNALDVEVAKVVNASGFTVKVQRLKEGQSPYLSPSSGRVSQNRSDSTSSLAHSGLSDNGGNDGGADSQGSSPRAVKTIRGQGRLNVGMSSEGGSQNGEVGRYVFGDIEPKICYCRILRSRKVMVRVGGGWAELSKFMEDHASLEQRKARSRLLSASNSSVSVVSHFGGSTTILSGTESRQQHPHDDADGSSDGLSDSQMSGSGDGEQSGTPGSRSNTNLAGLNTSPGRKKKEFIFHVRQGDGDDMSLKSIKLVKNAAGDGFMAV